MITVIQNMITVIQNKTRKQSLEAIPLISGIMLKSKAQVVIEFTLALILMMILLLGATKIFIWGNKNLVHRHQYYEETRVNATPDGEGEYVWDNSVAREKLDIFNQGEP